MINDNTYIINGRKAIFTTGMKIGIMSKSPMAVFTFEDNSKICVVYNMLTQKYSIIGAESIDKKVEFIYGAWKLTDDEY